MGKTQEKGVARPVKREVVSASANLEVISEENFARRLQGMSACINCQRERYFGNGRSRPYGPRQHGNSSSSSNYSNKQGRRGKQGRRKATKSNTPIVIHLKDTLRSALQQRQRSFETDSDVSVRSTDDDLTQDTFGDVSSIPEFVPQYMYQTRTNRHHQTSQARPIHSPQSQQRDKSKKNLTALISVLEKAHIKSSCHIESNLVGQTSKCSKFSHLLNNAVSVSEKIHSQQRSIADSDNVDVICNDLHKKEMAVEPVDDTDSVSDKSSVASSSETYSDSDSQVVEETAGFEFTAEELQRLAEYTTGFPIYRYECAPSECPECLSTWYSHQFHQYEGCSLNTAFSTSCDVGRSRNDSHQEAEHDTTLEASDYDGESVEDGGDTSRYEHRHSPEPVGVTASSSHNLEPLKSVPASSSSSRVVRADAAWRKGVRQLWDIDISHVGRRGGQEQRGNPHPNSVYLDLTGSDVSISIFYHHSLMQDEGARNAVAAFTATTSTPAVYTSTASSLYSFYYSSYLGSPTYGLSVPLSFFNNATLPKIAMVPPHELKKCKYAG